MTNHWVDLKNSDVILIIGGNPAENHPISFKWITAAMEDRGAKLIVVDPRFNRSAAKADVYAPIRSGTDIVFLGGLINYVIQNKLYNEEYVKAYTNALTLVNADFKGPADLDGYFSGWNKDTKAYDTATWQYQTQKVTVKDASGNDVEVSVPRQGTTLDDPNSVFALLKKHYARYSADMVERVCGTPKDKFAEVAKTFAATGAPEKSGTILYAMGQTQHTVGTQNVRSMAILQLLLGNIGMPGGGVNALRGESNVQGSTDMALLFGDLPGYLGLPTSKQPDLKTLLTKFDNTSYWSNGGRFVTTLLKAWWGNAATKDNDYAFNYLPKSSGNYSWIPLFEAMYQGTIKGMFVMGMNPYVSGPNARLERKGFANLDWLVVTELFDTETSSFWRAPGVDPKNVKTEVFLLPAADALEKAGTLTTSGRLMQWRNRVATPPGEAKEDIWILDRLIKAIKDAYKGSAAARDKPVLDLVWNYGENADVE